MRTQDSIKTAMRGLKHSRTRTILTMLGIVIGIASVILLMSIGQSAQNLILKQVEGTGSNLIFIIPGGSKGSKFASPASVQGVIIKTLIEEDYNSFKKEPSIVRVAPEVRGQARIVYENNDTDAIYEGTTEDFFQIRNFSFIKGHPFTTLDVASMNRVVVIGGEMAKTLFGDREPIGKSIRVKNLVFIVVGVLDKKGLGPFGVDQDNLIVLPISIAQKQLLGIDYYSVLNIEADPDYKIEFTKSRIISLLRQNHRITDPGKDDFTIRTQEDALALLGGITDVLTLFLTSIAFISLVVGGIGIMNIMLVSVIERTKEIGLRKAVGATSRDIIEQFLWESVMLTFLGGLIGILLGASMVIILYFLMTTFSPTGWSFALPSRAIFLAFVVSTLTGLIFGLYPARRAAALSPIEALRYE